MSRPIYNYCAGPAVLPPEVMNEAIHSLKDFRHGLAITEISHRGSDFMEIISQSKADLTDLLNIPAGYKILFFQGGATGQFAAIPLNLLGDARSADYVQTGVWSEKAIEEAQLYCDVNVAANTKATRYTTIPPQDAWQIRADSAYLHYTPNETIHGVEFSWVPKIKIPLVADMSSNLLSQPIDVSQFDLIYAGVQKNIGPAGMAVVIVKEDVIKPGRYPIPTILNYRKMIAEDSCCNTPAVFSWYVSGLMFKWLKAQGGLTAMAQQNQLKADIVYDAIDASDFYHNAVEAQCRSRMNIPFTLPDPKLDAVFLEKAQEQGLYNLAGHRSIGGMRASLYNAMPVAGAQALVDFMHDFERQYG
jgi:phosphoserine aminotransferase